MKTHIYILASLLLLAVVSPASAEVRIDGFLQGLVGGGLDKDNPTETDYTANETRMQLRAEHFADRAEFFGRLDFTYDGAVANEFDWELREGYMKFRLGSAFDFKIGRQILTWGTGDLIFINDVFAKDYRSFFVGRDDQYLKAPQTAIRAEYYGKIGNMTFVWSPRFEPNRLPTGDRLSYFNGMSIVGTGLDTPEMSYFFEPPEPDSEFKNGEFAFRWNKYLAGFSTSLYAYHGFYKNPRGIAVEGEMMYPIYPRLNVFGASVRGQVMGGILWIEGGYFDSQDDRDGDDPYLPNSSVTSMIGFERQIATNLTVNLQWQADYMMDYEMFEMQQQFAGSPFIRDELRHLLTSRLTKLLMNENLTLSSFVFYSPSDEDVYWRANASYKYTDEVTIAVGWNLFDGKHPNTDFGQFRKNDNVYLKLTYGF